VGVAHYTGAVANRARIRLAGSNEREIVTTLRFPGRGWLGQPRTSFSTPVV
jgi:hypothetical protein